MSRAVQGHGKNIRLRHFFVDARRPLPASSTRTGSQLSWCRFLNCQEPHVCLADLSGRTLSFAFLKLYSIERWLDLSSGPSCHAGVEYIC